jgi:hypothetical protein
VYVTTGVTVVLVTEKKSVTIIHKQLQNVYMSVLFIMALSLVLHKLQVLRKAKRCLVVNSNSFIQNDQWLTERKLAIRGVGRTVLMS